METIKEIKKQLGITNKDIAKMFGYKNLSSYQNASRKKKIESGIVEIITLSKIKYYGTVRAERN